jgi:hypothetical protein
VKRGEEEVPCLRRGKADLHSFFIPHFTDKDHFRRLPQRSSQPVGEIVEINAQFPLIESGFFLGMNVFHRVLKGDHVNRFGFVDIIKDRCKGRRLPASGGACHQNHSVSFLCHFSKSGRKHHFIDGGNSCG